MIQSLPRFNILQVAFNHVIGSSGLTSNATLQAIRDLIKYSCKRCTHSLCLLILRPVEGPFRGRWRIPGLRLMPWGVKGSLLGRWGLLKILAPILELERFPINNQINKKWLRGLPSLRYNILQLGEVPFEHVVKLTSNASETLQTIRLTQT